VFCPAVRNRRRATNILDGKEMGTKLFVGGLSWNTGDDMLREAFEPFGAVVEAKVINDRDTGRSRGFGFVTMSDSAHAQAAIAKLDGTSLDGRSIKVNEAEARSPRGGGGGGERGAGGGSNRW
jgi:cold-inducible RNA-binding protein